MSQAESTTREPARAPTARTRMDMTVRPRGLGGARAALKMAARAARAHAHEAALLLSVPAMAPLRHVRGDYAAEETVSPLAEAKPHPGGR